MIDEIGRSISLNEFKKLSSPNAKVGDKIAYAVVVPVVRCEIGEGEMGERYNMHDMEEADTKDGKGRI